MRKLKKQLFLIICLLLISALLFVGCGKGAKQAAVNQPAESTVKAEANISAEESSKIEEPGEADTTQADSTHATFDDTASETVPAEAKPSSGTADKGTTSSTVPSTGTNRPSDNQPTDTIPSTTIPPVMEPSVTEPSIIEPPETSKNDCQHTKAFYSIIDNPAYPVPTCTCDGYYLRECMDCNSESIVKAKALGHKTMATPYEHGYETPTCYKQGRTGAKEYCYICQTVIKEGDPLPINPTYHAGTTFLKNKKEATCTEEGYSGDNVCSYCENLNHPANKGHVTPAMGHVISGEDKATCCSRPKCINCGVPCEEIDLNNHAGGTEVRNAYAASPACCSGYSGDTYCLGCGTIISYGKNIPATQDHSYQEISRVESETELSITSQCTVCGTTSKVSISIG